MALPQAPFLGNRPTRFSTLNLSLLVIFFVMALLPGMIKADDSLALGSEQRQHLLQLEQAITSSQNPQATLQQVADANGISPQELVQLIQDAHGAGGQPTFAIGKLITSTSLLVWRWANQNPKASMLVFTASVALLYVSIMAPRTGLVISKNHGIWSKGHTTVWNPPTNYLHRYLESPSMLSKPVLSLPLKRKNQKSQDWIRELREERSFSAIPVEKLVGRRKKYHVDDYDDNDTSHLVVRWYKMPRKSILRQATTARIRINAKDILLANDEERKRKDKTIRRTRNDHEHEDDEDMYEEQNGEVLSLLWDAALVVMDNRRWTEFTDTICPNLRFMHQGRHAVLVVPKMGDYGRYGLVPWKSQQQRESEETIESIHTTLVGAHMDCHFRVFLQKKIADGGLLVGVDLVVPKRGRKIQKMLASRVVAAVCASIAHSVRIETETRRARRGQGHRVHRLSKDRAAERRRFRHEKEVQLEQMAADRRRKRRHINENAGRYRPSGHRQKSPNNC